MEEYTELRCKEMYAKHPTSFIAANVYTDDEITFKALKECVGIAIAYTEGVLLERDKETDPITLIRLESYKKILKDLTENSIKEFI